MRILCFNFKGGVGKTTLAIQLVSSIVAAGRQVTIQDLDQQKRLKKWVDNFNHPLVNQSGNYTIIDFPPVVDMELLNVLKTADVILVPTLVSEAEIEPVTNVKKMYLRHQLSAKIGVILWGFDSRAKARNDFRNQVEELLPLIGEIPRREVWGKIGATGKAIHEFEARWNRPATEDWRNLERAILQFLGQSHW